MRFRHISSLGCDLLYTRTGLTRCDKKYRRFLKNSVVNLAQPMTDRCRDHIAHRQEFVKCSRISMVTQTPEKKCHPLNSLQCRRFWWFSSFECLAAILDSLQTDGGLNNRWEYALAPPFSKLKDCKLSLHAPSLLQQSKCGLNE